MSFMTTKFDIVKRNTSEILTDEELEKLLRKKNPTIYHGYEPTGSGVHIGYILAINKLIDFQKAGFSVTVLFADLHAWLNEKGSLEKIAKIAELYKLSFASLGLDMKKVNVVMGTSFQMKPEYWKDVMKVSLSTRLARVRRSMTMIGRKDENPHVAQIFYPLMQAVDIKHLDVDAAAGDMAQRKVHAIAREELPNIGYRKPVAIHHPDLVGLTGGKMSSSLPETVIMIDENEDSIRQKISKAYCPEKETKGNPILQISQYIIFPSINSVKVERPSKFGGDIEYKSYEDMEKDFSAGRLHPADLKAATALQLSHILKPVRSKMSAKAASIRRTL